MVNREALKNTCQFLIDFRETDELVSRTKADLLSLVDLGAVFQRLTGAFDGILTEDCFLESVANVPGASEYFTRFSKRLSRREQLERMISSDNALILEEDFPNLFGTQKEGYRLPDDSGPLTLDRNLEIALAYLKIIIPIIYNLEKQRRTVVNQQEYVAPQVYKALKNGSYVQASMGYQEFCDILFRQLL